MKEEWREMEVRDSLFFLCTRPGTDQEDRKKTEGVLDPLDVFLFACRYSEVDAFIPVNHLNLKTATWGEINMQS